MRAGKSGQRLRELRVAACRGVSKPVVSEVEPVAAKHELESRPVRQGVVDVGEPRGDELRESVSRTVGPIAGHQSVQFLESDPGQLGQKAGGIAEVVCRRSMRDARAACALSEGETRKPPLLEERFGDFEKGASKGAMVVALRSSTLAARRGLFLGRVAPPDESKFNLTVSSLLGYSAEVNLDAVYIGGRWVIDLETVFSVASTVAAGTWLVLFLAPLRWSWPARLTPLVAVALSTL